MKSGGTEIGNVVIIKKDSTPRAFWRLARIQELLPGADGLKFITLLVNFGGVYGQTDLTVLLSLLLTLLLWKHVNIARLPVKEFTLQEKLVF